MRAKDALLGLICATAVIAMPAASNEAFEAEQPIPGDPGTNYRTDTQASVQRRTTPVSGGPAYSPDLQSPSPIHDPRFRPSSLNQNFIDPYAGVNQTGPEDPSIMAGPFRPIYSYRYQNFESGSEIHPGQQRLWDLMKSDPTEQVKNWVLATLKNSTGSKYDKRDIVSEQGDDGANGAGTGQSDLGNQGTGSNRPSKSHDIGSIQTENAAYCTSKPPRSFLSRAIALFRRSTIGQLMSQANDNANQPPGYNSTVFTDPTVPQVWNGQPGMVYVKSMSGLFHYCDNPVAGNSGTLLGYKIYLPKVFFYDGNGADRCAQATSLYWQTWNGTFLPGGDSSAPGKRLPTKTINFTEATVAGYCFDCYPWEVMAHDSLISLITPNNGYVVDWNNTGLWGVTIGLGTMDLWTGDIGPVAPSLSTGAAG